LGSDEMVFGQREKDDTVFVWAEVEESDCGGWEEVDVGLVGANNTSGFIIRLIKC